MTKTACLAFIPRDGLFCKDGRGWHTSASGRGHGLDWPWPSTILGALKSAWGRGEEARRGALFSPNDWRIHTDAIRLGRTLVLRRPHGAEWETAHCIWPVPLDALWLEGQREVYRLTPIEPSAQTLGRDDDEARESLWRPRLPEAGKPLIPPRWWNSQDFLAWLTEKPVAVRGRDQCLATARRVQTHVGIIPGTLTADEGVLFSHDVVETLELDSEWAIGAEVTLPHGDISIVATLGSDARLVCVESLPVLLFEPPLNLLEAFRLSSKGLRIIAVTPMCFLHGWLPDGFVKEGKEYRGRLPGLDAELILRAAFVPRPIHVSGWDMAAGVPKPTTRMVAPGAVYFFERTDRIAFSEDDARSLWLTALGSRIDEGYGRIVPGVWSPERSIL